MRSERLAASGHDAGARGRWARWTEPRPDGLPQVRVLLGFPALVAVVMLGLVAFGVTGSSSGIMHSFFETGPDPDHIALTPQAIRSDEWNVQTVYTVSQVEEGLPVENEALPGGVDMTLNWETPYAEWSAAFRPHNVGFFALPLDNAFALKWWLPGAALVAAAYMFVVSLWPRRPVAAALLAVAFYFSPFFQWWYLPQTLWPPAWALLVMTAVVWTQALPRGRARWGWSAAVGYVTVTAALGIYAPFLIPVAYVALGLTVGWVLRPGTGLPLRERLRRLVPVAVGGAAAAVVMVVFLATRLDTIRGFLGTVYPGQRLVAAGSGLADTDWEATFLGLFSLALRDGSSYGIRPNSSEASTFVFVGAFVALVGVWAVVRSVRRGRTDWPLVASLAVGLLLVAHMYVPGWDAVAHLLLLDRVQANRMVIGLGLLGIVLIGLVGRSLDREGAPAPWWLAVGAALASVGFHVAFFERIDGNAVLAAKVGPWPVLTAVFALAVLLFARRRPAAGAAAFAALSIVLAGWVNPFYRGVYDIRETEVAQAVMALEAEQPGTWAGVGGSYVGPILTETGVGGFNGFQSAPDVETWEAIDPEGRYEFEWNRFANVGWVVDPAAPRVFNPAGDQVRVNLDSCDPYEQEAVQHVLSDVELTQPCLELVDEVTAPGAVYRLYSVVPPSDEAAGQP
ncbi:DUF7657 domain-containing protein [Actinotalea solisilvae]|uniref:DUF7657 domain-containing protein n=1 Tax=Actinotalea solisilvae TaxID=2072922 RepID=UPI0018F16695|nr:hypothetical protein [Actinotalea solisilvae]